MRKMPRLLPDAMRVPLKWSAQVVPTDIAGIFVNSFCINDPFYNPDRPLGWDEWSQFYNLFYINTASIQIIINMQGADPGGIILFPAASANNVSSSEQAAQQPYARFLTLGNAHQNSTRNKMRMKFSVSKLLGQRLTGENWDGSTSTGMSVPGNRVFFNMFGYADDGVVNNIQFRVVLYQYVRFYRRKTLSLSS